MRPFPSTAGSRRPTHRCAAGTRSSDAATTSCRAARRGSARGRPAPCPSVRRRGGARARAGSPSRASRPARARPPRRAPHDVAHHELREHEIVVLLGAQAGGRMTFAWRVVSYRSIDTMKSSPASARGGGRSGSTAPGCRRTSAARASPGRLDLVGEPRRRDLADGLGQPAHARAEAPVTVAARQTQHAHRVQRGRRNMMPPTSPRRPATTFRRSVA